jgi:hypothetical protein
MRRWSVVSGWVVLGPLALAACVSNLAEPEGERFTGHYSQGFEVDSFRPCGSEESWWVTQGDELRARYRALAPGPYEEVYVEVRGHAGPTGEFGHLGAYDRELAAGEVVTIRPAADRDCG